MPASSGCIAVNAERLLEALLARGVVLLGERLGLQREAQALAAQHAFDRLVAEALAVLGDRVVDLAGVHQLAAAERMPGDVGALLGDLGEHRPAALLGIAEARLLRI